MTIEITFDDLVQLVEVARSNGSSVMFMTHSTDGKRASLLVVADARRKHRARAATEKPHATEKENGAAADPQ